MYLLSAQNAMLLESMKVKEAKGYIIQRFKAISHLHLHLLNVLTKLPVYITRGVVLTYIVLCNPVTRGENPVASCNRATKLRGCLPDHLSEMRSHWIAGVVLGSFRDPIINGVSNGIITSTSGKIFAKCAKSAPRVLEDASIGPLLRFGG